VVGGRGGGGVGVEGELGEGGGRVVEKKKKVEEGRGMVEKVEDGEG
jgi:hypothetical protein